VVALVATIALASLSYYLLEHPILNLKDRFFSFRKPRSEEKTRTITADS
jgi:peptidoglycan/LPS O-acetylase OafA/YrhL